MAAEGSELDYELLGLLGVGSFGHIYLARRRGGDELRAVKRLDKARIISAKQVDHALSEVQVLREFSHPFAVGFKGLYQTDSHLELVLDYVAGGSLFTHLRKAGSLPKHDSVLYSAQIVLLFSALHQKSIIYRDLKPQNILIEIDGYLKLTDFGFSKVIQDRTYTLCGTPEYLAPQIIRNVGHSSPVDWWTLGVLLSELLVGIDPFADQDPLVIYQNILACRLLFPKGFDKEAKSLVKHLLVADLSKRYGNTSKGCRAIKEHKFYDKLDWQALLDKALPMPYLPDPSEPQPQPIEKVATQLISRDADPFYTHL